MSFLSCCWPIQAYIDFSDLDSCASLVNKYPNLVVLQTFSKSWGLAGARCGVAIANEQIVATMNKFKAPYNISKVTSRIAVSALQHLEQLVENVQKIKQERSRVMAALEVCLSIFFLCCSLQLGRQHWFFFPWKHFWPYIHTYIWTATAPREEGVPQQHELRHVCREKCKTGIVPSRPLYHYISVQDSSLWSNANSSIALFVCDLF